MTLKEVANKTGQSLKRHAPEILTGLSVVGLGGTAYLTSRAGFRAGLHVMDETHTRKNDAAPGEDVELLTGKEIFQATWRYYIPAATIGVITAVAIIGSNRISAQRNVALISAAAIGERAFQEYREKTAEALTKPKERKLHDDVAQDRVNDSKDKLDNLVLKKDGDVMVIEMHTRQVFVSTAEKIHKAENDANRECLIDGYISLNVFLDNLGLPWSEAGSVVGWNNEKPLEVIIGGANHDGSPVLTIDYRTPPSVTFQNPF